MIAAGLAAAAALAASSAAYEDLMTCARDAFAAERWSDAAGCLDEAQTLRPYSQHVMRNRVVAHAAAGDDDGALDILDAVATAGLVLTPPDHPLTADLRASARYAAIAERMARNAEPWGDAQVAEYDASHRLPEALARDGRRLVVGSAATGRIAATDGKAIANVNGGVYDIEMRDRTLWAAVNNQLAYDGDREPPFAAIVALDRRTGAERARIALNDGPTLVGDLEVFDDRLYASDSLTPRIIVASEDGDSIHSIVDPRFVNMQGIAVDRRRGVVFAADYLAGLFAVDLGDGAVTRLANPGGAWLGGVDGLYLYDGDLIGVQNGTTPQRIVRIRLDADGRTALGLNVLQQASPQWNEPTHALVDGDRFVYIATSNWPAFGDDGKQKPETVLEPLRLMSIDLKSKRLRLD